MATRDSSGPSSAENPQPGAAGAAATEIVAYGLPSDLASSAFALGYLAQATLALLDNIDDSEKFVPISYLLQRLEAGAHALGNVIFNGEGAA